MENMQSKMDMETGDTYLWVQLLATTSIVDTSLIEEKKSLYNSACGDACDDPSWAVVTVDFLIENMI